MILIFGAPRSGKTTLARQLVGVERRIHMDNICVMLALRRPDLLPPEIAGEIPDVDLVEISRKIRHFCVHLAEAGSLGELVREYVGVVASRRLVLVAEGYALDYVGNAVRAFHRETVLSVETVGGGISIGGRVYSREDGVDFLKQRLLPIHV